MSTPELRVEGDAVTGEIALAIAPGTRADVQDRAIDDALADAFHALAVELGVTLTAPPSRFAMPLDGRDEGGCVRFVVRGRLEGDRLVPVRPKKVARRPHADVRAAVRAEKKAAKRGGEP